MTGNGSTMSGGCHGCKGGTPVFQGHSMRLKKSNQQAFSYFTLQFCTFKRLRVGLACACGTQKQKRTDLKNHLDVRTAKARTYNSDLLLSQSVTGKLEVNIILWSRAYVLMDPLTKQRALVRTIDWRVKQAMETGDAVCPQIHATPDNSNE